MPTETMSKADDNWYQKGHKADILPCTVGGFGGVAGSQIIPPSVQTPRIDFSAKAA